MAYFWLLGSSILFTVLAQLFLKKGVLGLGQINISLNGLWNLFLAFIGNIYLAMGLVCFGIAFFSWVLTLSKIKLSVAYPISTALNLSLVTLGSYLIFKENLSVLQLAGIFSIIVGIFLLLWRY